MAKRKTRSRSRRRPRKNTRSRRKQTSRKTKQKRSKSRNITNCKKHKNKRDCSKHFPKDCYWSEKTGYGSACVPSIPAMNRAGITDEYLQMILWKGILTKKI